MSFAFAIINLVIGLQKSSEKSYLFFGAMAFCVGIYYLLFPMYPIAVSKDITNKIGLSFFILAFGFFPWFIKYYTKREENLVPWILSGGMFLSLLLFLLINNHEDVRWWNITAHISILGIIAYGFSSSYQHYKSGLEKSALFLMIAFIPVLMLAVDDIIYVYFNDYYFFNLPENILLFDYFFILFMLIMGSKLVRDIQYKYHLEKLSSQKDKRWRKLLEEVELIIVELSNDGIIKYVNPYFLTVTGYKDSEVLGKNWFMSLLPKNDGQRIYKVFNDNLEKDNHPHYRNPIIISDGEERLISWSNVVLNDETGNPMGTISIGNDITKSEAAYSEIKSLKSKLELENIILKAELKHSGKEAKIIGKSDAISYVLQRAKQVSDTDSTVLLEGETGVGKELIANFIHQNSGRAEKPYIKLNCAAIPATLLESELFGYTKGAFTGADRNKKGVVELSDGGTLMLDEIGEFPIELQPKLLRFLQDGEFKQLGSETSKKADVRIIAATNRELLKEIENGRFRNDLYYRLYVYPITIPPLRSRMEDIPEMIEVFLKRFSKKHTKVITKVSKLVIEELKRYKWPGNIRELENVIERAVIICNFDTIKIKDIKPIVSQNVDLKAPKNEKILKLEDAEREHILKALKHTNWQIHGYKGAAELLGINPSTLRSRMKKLDITKPL